VKGDASLGSRFFLGEYRISVKALVAVLELLYRNHGEERSLNDLLLESPVSRSTFYRVLKYLIDRELAAKRIVKNRLRGKGRITVYSLTPKGERFYYDCIRPFLMGST